MKHSKLYSVLSYITWIGWLVALFLRDKNDALVRRHLNQALILNIIGTAASLATRLGGVFRMAAQAVNFAALILTIMGIVRAVKMSAEPLPYIGEFTLID